MMRLDHFLIIADDMPRMRAFFCDVIGLEDGARPPFPFAGHWLYSEGRPLVHIAEGGRDDGREAFLGARGAVAGRRAVDHIALVGADFAEMSDRFAALGTPHSIREVPAEGHRQIFVPGPEGVTIEFLFPLAGNA